uniref:Uncharacterized protein n=1 Tax=Anopheles culicifacies TaxID=139723 RepID=A0A182MGM5_9DIPT
MKFFAYIVLAVVLFAQIVLAYQNYGQGSEQAEEDFCLSEPCETFAKDPSDSSRSSPEEQNVPQCACGQDSWSGSVADEIQASVFERTGPRFESHLGRSPVRRTDYPVAGGTFKSRKPVQSLEVVEPEKKKDS